MAAEVSVCVPVYRAHAAPNIGTLSASLPAALEGRTGELVVALNGIPAGVAGVGEDARTVDMGSNRGVAPGWNAAARASDGRVLVFANDDVLLRPGAIARLVEALEQHSDAGVVGPVGARWDRRRWRHEATVRPSEGIAACDAVSGFLFACSRDVWERAGGFDEAYAPASWEEIDFNFAVQQLGLRSYAVAACQVDHDWGISARQPPWRTIRWDGRRELLWLIHRRNRRHFIAKWASGAQAAR